MSPCKRGNIGVIFNVQQLLPMAVCHIININKAYIKLTLVFVHL